MLIKRDCLLRSNTFAIVLKCLETHTDYVSCFGSLIWFPIEKKFTELSKFFGF